MPTSPPRVGRAAADESLARLAVPARRHLRRRGHELRASSPRSPSASSCACSTRTAPRRASTLPERTAFVLARLPARRRPGPALRLPRARAVGPGARPALQPRQAAARPLRQGDRGRGRLGRGGVRLPLRRPRRRRERRSTARRSCRKSVVVRPVLRLGRRPAAAHAAGTRRSSTRPTSRASRSATRTSPRSCAAPTPGSPTRRRSSYLHGARRHRGRAAAGPPVRPRRPPRRARAAQLLGLQLDRLLRAAQRLRAVAGTRGEQVQEFKQMVKALHAAGHRGDPRRRLQPHRRGQPPRARRCRSRASTTPPTTAWSPDDRALLHGLHRHRQQPQHAPPARAAADHGLAALLGHRDARRRLPLRPRVDARARAPRGRPARRRSSTSSSRTRWSAR